MILDEKVVLNCAPPPYEDIGAAACWSTLFARRLHSQETTTLTTLPSHIILQIVNSTLPTHSSSNSLLAEQQRRALLWMTTSLRLVSKALYLACMHILRSTYLPSYTSRILSCYTSDPFPYTTLPHAHGNSICTMQRETGVLDKYITLSVHEDNLAGDSELHSGRTDMFKDLFHYRQPKARLEDLVRLFGVEDGVVTPAPPGTVIFTTVSVSSLPASGDSSIPTHSPPASPSSSAVSKFLSLFKPRNTPKVARPASPHLQSPKMPSKTVTIRPIPFAMLSVSFTTRKVGLQLSSSLTGSKRTVVELQRYSRNEHLESTASQLVEGLKNLLLLNAEP